MRNKRLQAPGHNWGLHGWGIVGKLEVFMGELSPYINPLWPEAEWDVSGAFVNDRELIAFFDYTKRVLGFEPFHLVHGAPLCNWNSGRVLKQLLRSVPEMHAVGKAYEQRRIAVYLTFSNLLIEESHLSDPLGNALLRFFDRHNPTQKNGVIMASEALRAYVRREFPGLRCVSSILHIVNRGGKGRADVYKRLAEEYDEVMVHPDDVLNDALLETLEDKGRYTLLVNEYCIRNCPLRPYHYKTLSEMSLNFFGFDGTEFEKRQSKNGCRDLMRMLIEPRMEVLALTTLELAHLYEMGFRRFKLQGRGHANAAGILFDLVRLIWRQDGPEENEMQTQALRFFESLTSGRVA